MHGQTSSPNQGSTDCSIDCDDSGNDDDLFLVLAELASFNGASESEQDEEHASTSSSSAADLDVIVIGVSNRSPSLSLCCRRLRSSVVVVSDVIVSVAIAVYR